jgi:ATP-binding protein involved in chromosome partitioning
MISREEIEQALETIPVPGVGLSLSRMNLIQGIEIQEQTVKLTLASTGLSDARQEWIKTKVEEALGKVPQIEKGEIVFKEFKPAEINRITHIIAVISGKGGVGKSLVSSLLAVSLNRQGHSVGILDADLTGPSIPRMFGLHTRPEGTPSAILPVLSQTGIEVMSLNLILTEEDEAVIWRGPVITGVIRQFWEGVAWGNLDFLIVDLPPGTADAPLTVMQQFPVTGVVIVFTPQALTAMIVRKTVKMAQKMEKPILGLVENMSYLYIPEMQKRLEIFGPSKAEQMVEASKAPLLAQIPIDPVLTKLCDEGKIENYNSEAVKNLGTGLTSSIEALARTEAP